MREKLKKVLKAQSVNYLFYFITFLSISGCYLHKKHTTNTPKNKNYIITKHTSFNNWITIKIIDKEIPYIVDIMINNIFFSNKFKSFNVSEGKHNIDIYHLSKRGVRIKDLIIQKNDSIVLTVYLEDDNIPNID